MTHVTTRASGPVQPGAVIASPPLLVTILSRDPAMRIAAARAFDAAPVSWEVSLEDGPSPRTDVLVVTPEVEDVPTSDAPTVPFDPLNPAAAIEAVALLGKSRPPLLTAVLGATGGCGATTIAIHLARALGDAVFAEVGEPAASTLSARFSLDLSGDRAGPISVEGLHAFVLPDPADLSDLLGYRRAVVDLGCGAEPLACAPTLCVLPPTLVAARRAARIIKSGPEIDWIVVTNRVGAGGTATRMELQQGLGAPISLDLPGCPALRDSEDTDRMPLGSWRGWHRGIRRLARAIERHVV